MGTKRSGAKIHSLVSRPSVINGSPGEVLLEDVDNFVVESLEEPLSAGLKGIEEVEGFGIAT